MSSAKCRPFCWSFTVLNNHCGTQNSPWSFDQNCVYRCPNHKSCFSGQITFRHSYDYHDNDNTSPSRRPKSPAIRLFVKQLVDQNSASLALCFALQWRHNEHNGVSNHQPYDCLPKRLFRRRSKKTPKLRVTGLCAGNSAVTVEFPVQMASNAENVSIWWRHHGTHRIVRSYLIKIYRWYLPMPKPLNLHLRPNHHRHSSDYHDSNTTWPSWRLKSPATPLFVKQFVDQNSASLAVCFGNPLVTGGSFTTDH